ncbi:hypothetical protein, partial [Salmonella enterica]|uniref:hypothetical protein n=1 Tax=Salmonella enterica TaxID=28901 RepID=UPI001C382CC9
PPQETTHRQTTDKTKGPVFRLSLLFYLMSGSSLLSHGETPHYHRRYGEKKKKKKKQQKKKKKKKKN